MQSILAYVAKELLVALLSAEQADQECANSIQSEQGSDRIELGGEDLEYDECEGELSESRA